MLRDLLFKSAVKRAQFLCIKLASTMVLNLLLRLHQLSFHSVTRVVDIISALQGFVVYQVPVGSDQHEGSESTLAFGLALH